ncbi:hypothetical protein EsH8_IX_000568 [Colletotrichum jinshuiense]
MVFIKPLLVASVTVTLASGLLSSPNNASKDVSNAKNVDWIEKIWDWSANVGTVDTSNGHAKGHAESNLFPSNYYSTGTRLYSAAVMANHTGGAVWKDRARKILQTIEDGFFYRSKDGTSLMHDPVCDPVKTSNTDMMAVKNYLAQSLLRSTSMMPELSPRVKGLLRPSSLAADKTCNADSDLNIDQVMKIVGIFPILHGAIEKLASSPLIKAEVEDNVVIAGTDITVNVGNSNGSDDSDGPHDTDGPNDSGDSDDSDEPEVTFIVNLPAKSLTPVKYPRLGAAVTIHANWQVMAFGFSAVVLICGLY